MPRESKSVGTHDCAGMDHTARANFTMGTDRDPRMEHGLRPDMRSAPKGAARADHRASADLYLSCD